MHLTHCLRQCSTCWEAGSVKASRGKEDQGKPILGRSRIIRETAKLEQKYTSAYLLGHLAIFCRESLSIWSKKNGLKRTKIHMVGDGFVHVFKMAVTKSLILKSKCCESLRTKLLQNKDAPLKWKGALDIVGVGLKGSEPCEAPGKVHTASIKARLRKCTMLQASCF